ncbi:MAG TPA: 3-dehydroquinate synthase [Pyrinomonadaceae bacterium]
MTAKALRRVRVRLGGGAEYSIEIGAGALDHLGEAARRVLHAKARRVALVSNRLVFDLYGARAEESLRAAGFTVAHWLMGDGERHKTLRTAERALEFLSAAGIERSDAVVALGGGVVGDLAGFAAALHLRGVAFLQAPTTLLAQIDSSVGGKTGVNTHAGKNLVGVFHQPRAVVVDTETLRTLPARELTAGWCEAVKQGAAGDLKLFRRTVKFLAEESEEARSREDELIELIAAHCEFKARIVAGDEREDLDRADAGSRRILNFGHTVGHALEAVTGFRRFRHGEAVGYGMLVAGEISKKLGMLAASELECLREAVRLAGRLPRAGDISEERIRHALLRDKKSVNGRVLWVLLEGLGRAALVDGSEVSARVLRDALGATLATRSAKS